MWRTEQESLKTHCPIKLAGLLGAGPHTIGDVHPRQMPAFTNCEGTGCMMYRQNIITDQNGTSTKGYCGLAGIPPR
jgi:hypothetical protein